MENELKTVDEFLTNTTSLLNHVYWFKKDLLIPPSKEHIGTAIAFSDISERKHDFIRELVNTITSWVYSNEKCKNIINTRIEATDIKDYPNAYSFLVTQAHSKFRPGHPQGQFGELLLFNFIQHFFKAVPLLRKQKITTSVGFERFGADALHFKKEDDKNIILIGESKCYESKYQFSTAFKNSLESIVETVSNFHEELDLYVYDDFIEPELEIIAQNYKNNILPNVHFEYVSLIAYNENKKIDIKNENEIKSSIMKIIEERCLSLDDQCFDKVDKCILERLNYIIFPIWKLDELLEKFTTLIGA